jgi:hypothetical protein
MEAGKAPSGVIAIFVPGLEDTPGWVALSRKKQDALLEHTSHIQQNRQLQMLGEFGELMELYQVQQLLDGEAMKMADYLRRIYPDRHKRTIDRKREVFAQLVEKIPTSVMKRLTAIGAEALTRFDRIANAALGDIRNAVKELPALSAGTDKAAEKYLEELDSKLLEHRQMKRKGKPLHQDEQYAAKMATNAVLHYMRGCPTLKTSNQKSKFLTRVMGWVMEAQAVSGTLRAGRISIPAGVLIVRGRPRKHPKKEVA